MYIYIYIYIYIDYHVYTLPAGIIATYKPSNITCLEYYGIF